jgi:hypothetical protein
MNEPVSITLTSGLPPIFVVWPDARKRLRDFFSSHIRIFSLLSFSLSDLDRSCLWCELADLEPVLPIDFVMLFEVGPSRQRTSFAQSSQTVLASAAAAVGQFLLSRPDTGAQLDLSA